MLRALEELEAAGLIDDRHCAIARVAAWFHDAIYDPAATPGSNEADSAVLARESLQRLRVIDEDIDCIERLIRLTARHDTDAEDPLDAAFQDADLWILSAPTSRFDGYCQQVREEYAQVSDAVFRRGRMAVLGPLLERDKIYRTSRALQHWEGPARINLGRELTRLNVQT
jgi:predicted metal-dependent HD superfamily phosphohydrolase